MSDSVASRCHVHRAVRFRVSVTQTALTSKAMTHFVCMTYELYYNVVTVVTWSGRPE